MKSQKTQTPHLVSKPILYFAECYYKPTVMMAQVENNGGIRVFHYSYVVKPYVPNR